MKMKWAVQHHGTLYKRYFALDEYRVTYDKFDGGQNTVVREVFERGDAVCVLPYDPLRDEIVLVEQFRAGAIRAVREGGPDSNIPSPWLLELIAGIIEPGETEEEVVYREAREEAACEIRECFRAYRYLVSPGGASERTSLYIARARTEGLGGVHGLDHEHEDIRVHVLKRAAALAMLEAGVINNAVAIIGLQWLALHYRDLQTRWK